MSKYAKETTVPIEKTKTEIEKVLKKYGATGFYSGWQDDPPASAIGFTIAGRMVRIDMPMPSLKDHVHSEKGRKRSKEAARKACDQATKQKWRALLLIIKAKLEFVDCGISSIEREFLADVLLPNGEKLGECLSGQLDTAYSTGKMPSLLPGRIK